MHFQKVELRFFSYILALFVFCKTALHKVGSWGNKVDKHCLFVRNDKLQAQLLKLTMRYDFASFILFLMQSSTRRKRDMGHLKIGNVLDLHLLEDDLLRGTQDSVTPKRTKNFLGLYLTSRIRI